MKKQPDVELTKAQQRIYDLIILGLSAKEVADRLNVCEATVKYHLANIRELFEVNSTASLIALHYMGKAAFWEARSPWNVGEKVKVVGSSIMPDNWVTNAIREVAIAYPSGIKCTQGRLYTNKEIQRITQHA